MTLLLFSSWSTYSRVYVNKVISRLPKLQLHLATPVIAVKTTAGPRPSVLVTTESGETLTFDHVIMACHSDMSLKLLERGGHVAPEERNILGGVSWSKNRAVLHSDIAVSTLGQLHVSFMENHYAVDAPEKDCLVVLELFDIICKSRWDDKSQHQSGGIVSVEIASGITKAESTLQNM